MSFDSSLTPNREMAGIATQKQVRQDAASRYILQCVAIQVFNIINTPIKELRILDSMNKRVHNVFFLPHGHVVTGHDTIVDLDPVIPVTTFNLGPRYIAPMRHLTRHLITWNDKDSFSAQETWGAQARNMALNVIAALNSPSVKGQLAPDELDYMKHHINLAVAVPFMGGLFNNGLSHLHRGNRVQGRLIAPSRGQS